MLNADCDNSTRLRSAAPGGPTLAEWLDWQLQLHPHSIELELERVQKVAARLDVLPLAARCVIVAGTNGKGSCVRLLETLLRARGQRVGAYTSPHLWRYNERIRIDGADADDAALCTAFAAVEEARQEVQLTFFEYGTLAALWLFQQAELDFALLEVGLGGRLDAVNIVDAEVALITNIGLDHTAWLGDTRAAIGLEKAGVMRADQAVVCTDKDLPRTVSGHAAVIGADLYRLEREFAIDAQGWHGWAGRQVSWSARLPAHVLPENLAGVLAVMALLGQWPLSATVVMQACQAQGGLHGRREVIEQDGLSLIFDVAHNVEAVTVLAQSLRDNPVAGATHIVLGMLADKPVRRVARMLLPLADHVYAADLAEISERGLDAAALAQQCGCGARPAGPPAAALAAAKTAAKVGDRIVVCGSFFTVAHARMEPE